LAVTVLAIATPLSTSGRFIVDAHGKRVRPEPYGLLTLDWTSVGYPAVVTMLQTMMQPHTGPGIG
jgi:hypothetical protein